MLHLLWIGAVCYLLGGIAEHSDPAYENPAIGLTYFIAVCVVGIGLGIFVARGW